MSKKPIELYFADTPNGWKISIMLEECKIPYKIVSVNIGKGEQFKPSFLKISPNNIFTSTSYLLFGYLFKKELQVL